MCISDWSSDVCSSDLVTEPAVRRLPRSLGAEIHQPSAIVAKLREQEAAPVADIGVVIAELVAVIAQRERCGTIIGQGFEPAEMGDPLGVAQRVQPHALTRAIVNDEKPRIGTASGLDRHEASVAWSEGGGSGEVTGG